ncbi:MAG TPA: energy transducer TonB [Blastocatellia bacterium]|nr:energy transducer TonB [Blastocatellia bacterium]
MFDKLVESAKQKQGGRAKRLFLATSLIYAVALSAFGVMAIMGFSPALAGEYNVIVDFIPPPVPQGAPEVLPKRSSIKPGPSQIFIEPKRVLPLPDPQDDKNLVSGTKLPVTYGGFIPWSGSEAGIPGGADMKALPTPPPPPTPTPVVKPVVTPTPDSVVRLTSVLTQGQALRKVEPPYPTLAKQARVQGIVQVQIGISETGEVNDVSLLSGHPLLREAALRAAKQWSFKPTELNGRPVRAIGLITFNFKLD